MTTTTTTTTAPTITSLVLIPPILDCIVTYLHTIDLLSWSSTSRITRSHILSSHVAWRAISFHTPSSRCCSPRCTGGSSSSGHGSLRRENLTSVFASTIAVRSHNASPRTLHTDVSDGANGNGLTLTAGSNGNNTTRYLSIDTTLTVLARLLPLAMYTSIDLSRTMADKHLLRDLVDTCVGLRYLTLEDCPKLRVADLVVGLYGVEKRVLKGLKGKGGVGGGEVSLVAEVMGRTRVVSGNNVGGGGGAGGGGAGGNEKAGAEGHGHGVLSRLTHVHTKEVRDGLYRLSELRDGVRGEIVRVMSRMEDVYCYPDMPGPLEFERKGVVQLREIRTDLKLHRSTYNGPGWLERLAYSQGDYLWVLCHLLGVTLICTDS